MCGLTGYERQGGFGRGTVIGDIECEPCGLAGGDVGIYAIVVVLIHPPHLFPRRAEAVPGAGAEHLTSFVVSGLPEGRKVAVAYPAVGVHVC